MWPMYSAWLHASVQSREIISRGCPKAFNVFMLSSGDVLELDEKEAKVVDKVHTGEVLVDGVNVKDYKLETLYNKLGYVPQKAVMFTGTVSSNVSYGSNGRKKADKDKIIKLENKKDKLCR